MSQINDGGPAFPDSEGQANYTGGMTLRDYFAAKAMQGHITSNLNLPPDDVAFWAYKYADAMLAEQEKSK